MNNENEYYLVLKCDNERCFKESAIHDRTPHINLYTLADVSKYRFNLSDCILVQVMHCFIDKDSLEECGVRTAPWYATVNVVSSYIDIA